MVHIFLGTVRTQISTCMHVEVNLKKPKDLEVYLAWFLATGVRLSPPSISSTSYRQKVTGVILPDNGFIVMWWPKKWHLKLSLLEDTRSMRANYPSPSSPIFFNFAPRTIQEHKGGFEILKEETLQHKSVYITRNVETRNIYFDNKCIIFHNFRQIPKNLIVT